MSGKVAKSTASEATLCAIEGTVICTKREEGRIALMMPVTCTMGSAGGKGAGLAAAGGLGAALGATFGAGAATGFLAAGFANFVGRGLPDLGLEFAVGFEGFESFLAALGLAAGRDGLFEEVVFVFNLLSVRPGEKAVEHPTRGSSGQGFVFGFFASRPLGSPGSRCDS